MTAPTADEIRAAIEPRTKQIEWYDAMSSAVEPLMQAAWQAVGHSEPRETPVEPNPEWDVLWWDLRPSQVRRLYELTTDANARIAARCTQILVDELVAAGVAFAAEYPDAPRAEREVAA